jgi:hypothetical protein
MAVVEALSRYAVFIAAKLLKNFFTAAIYSRIAQKVLGTH